MNVEQRRQVGVAEARAHLGELIDRVEAGETIEITRAGRTVALVGPAAPPRRPVDLDWLQRMTDSMPFGADAPADQLRRHLDAARY